MLHIRTPLILHPGLSTPTRRIWLKLENLQPSGSFKLRGMGLLCSQAAEQGKRKVVCPSGGNAGLATAVAAANLGLKACIVVPNTTPETTRARIRKTGAEVIVHGKVWDEANQRAKELAQGADTEYVPAFDHPVLWEGHSTMIDEILEDCPQVDALVTSVGGGRIAGGPAHRPDPSSAHGLSDRCMRNPGGGVVRCRHRCRAPGQTAAHRHRCHVTRRRASGRLAGAAHP